MLELFYSFIWDLPWLVNVVFVTRRKSLTHSIEEFELWTQGLDYRISTNVRSWQEVFHLQGSPGTPQSKSWCLHSNANFNWPISSQRWKIEEHGKTETEISRMPVVEPRKARRSLQNALEKNEETICHYYAESFDISTKDFIALILLDSIFIIENLWRTKQISLKSCSSNGLPLLK